MLNLNFQMKRPDGVVHNPRSCWKDLYYALMEAEDIICITGWAVWTGTYNITNYSGMPKTERPKSGKMPKSE